jgi:hypothetical protein
MNCYDVYFYSKVNNGRMVVEVCSNSSAGAIDQIRARFPDASNITFAQKQISTAGASLRSEAAANQARCEQDRRDRDAKQRQMEADALARNVPSSSPVIHNNTTVINNSSPAPKQSNVMPFLEGAAVGYLAAKATSQPEVVIVDRPVEDDPQVYNPYNGQTCRASTLRRLREEEEETRDVDNPLNLYLNARQRSFEQLSKHCWEAFQNDINAVIDVTPFVVLWSGKDPFNQWPGTVAAAREELEASVEAIRSRMVDRREAILAGAKSEIEIIQFQERKLLKPTLKEYGEELAAERPSVLEALWSSLKPSDRILLPIGGIIIAISLVIFGILYLCGFP